MNSNGNGENREIEEGEMVDMPKHWVRMSDLDTPDLSKNNYNTKNTQPIMIDDDIKERGKDNLKRDIQPSKTAETNPKP